MSAGDDTIRTPVALLDPSSGAKQIFVQAKSDAKTQDGSQAHPFVDLQQAINRALPGDTIRIGAGVYNRPVVLRHGGTKDAPLTIQGEGPTLTILDGGKRFPDLVSIADVRHVILSGLQIRGFQNNGIRMTGSEHVTLTNHYFLNASLQSAEDDNGEGISMRDCPNVTISYNLFTKLEHGVAAMFCPGLKLTHNTAYRNTYSAASLYASMEGSEISYNSFNFTGNNDISFRVKEDRDVDAAIMNHNNYGTKLNRENSSQSELRITPSPRYGKAMAVSSGGKAILSYSGIGKSERRFTRLEDWRSFSRQDQNSIFVDPEFVDPLNMDFRLMPDSPNILPDGKIIGAFPVKTRD